LTSSVLVNEQRLSGASLSSSGSVGSNLSSAGTGFSLFHALVKTIQKILSGQHQSNGKQLQQLERYAFALLTNCAQSNECKNIIWKSNLMQDFTAIDFQASKSNANKLNNYNGATSASRQKLWLQFIVSLSFSHDGQLFIMKVENLFTTLIKFWQSLNLSGQILIQQQQYDIQYLLLLILRNLAFNSANKSKLISSGKPQNSLMLLKNIFLFIMPFLFNLPNQMNTSKLYCNLCK
jgi:hypothetical protein